MTVDWVGYGYAALVASGGVIGYVKAGESRPVMGSLHFNPLSLGVTQTQGESSGRCLH